MTSALILLGFDISHAVMTLTNVKPSKAVAVLATVGNILDPRASIAFSSLSQVANAMGVQIERIDVPVEDVENSVRRIHDEIVKLVQENPPLFIDMGGGLRLLVIETFLAYLQLSKTLKNLVKLVVYIEGTNRSIELEPTKIENAFTITQRLTTFEKEVLETMEINHRYKLKEIYELVTQKGYKVSKQYIYKTLKKLEKLGLVNHEEGGYYTRKI